MLRPVGLLTGLLLLHLLMALSSSPHSYAFDPTRNQDAVLQTAASVHVVFTTICRNEAVNFRANLPLWLKVIEYFVFIMDDRTSDDSEKAIADILDGKALGYKILPHKFEGFGQARTASLVAAWEYFPQATHVLIADPDWRPKVETLSKEHLVYNAQVFRLIVYDRNGGTFRNVDWLLRHRQGLKMRYSLHEVLDIDVYAVAIIPWQAEEIEKPGTWHDKVGHGHSRSLKRFEFDLDMLYKDLPTYSGVDPHLNYYLAVTHDAYANSLAGDLMNRTGDSRSAEVEYHRKMSLSNGTLRALEPYSSEFLEQRWGAQFIAGHSYGTQDSVLFNHVKAIYWFSICRDFGPGQTECLRTLVELLYTLGDFGAAVNYAYDIVRVNPSQRLMLNSRHEKECFSPHLAGTLLGESLQREVEQRSASLRPLTGLSTLAQYVLHLRTMIKRPLCLEGQIGRDFQARYRSVDDRMEGAIAKAIEADGATAHKSVQEACDDKSFQQYIASNKFYAYDCDQLRILITQTRLCVDFTTNIPPPSEDLQVNVYGEYIGAASLLDVIHHVYMGDISRLTRPDKVYRVLFAEFFNPRMLNNLIGAAARRLDSRIEIVVLRNNQAQVQLMKETIFQCGIMNSGNVEFIVEPLDTFVATIQSTAQFEFDYIEYNAGVNLSPTHSRDLVLLRKVLAADGVIGLTYFTANVHQETLTKLISAQLEFVHVPFSLRAEYLMKNYLEHHGLSSLKDDKALFAFFGGDLDRNMYDTSRRNASTLQSRRVFNQSALVSLLTASNLQAVSWFPSSFAKPFEELDHYEVKKFQTAGLSQDFFIETLMPMFRYSLYVTKIGSRVPGRARVHSIQDFVDADDITILDRYETLGTTFDNAAVKALSGASTTLHFSYYGIPHTMRLVYYVNYVLLPGLDKMSTSPRMSLVLRDNDAFWEDPSTLKAVPNVEQLANRTLYRIQVGQLFDVLERMNAITFIHYRKARSMKTYPMAIQEEKDVSGSLKAVLSGDGDVDLIAQRPSLFPISLPARDGKTLIPVISDVDKIALEDEIASLMSLLSGKKTRRSLPEKLMPATANKPRSLPGIDGKIMMARVSSIELPFRQTRADIERSSRSTSCIDNKNSLHCYKRPSGRRTASLDTACSKKIAFDVRQLNYIALRDDGKAETIKQDILPRVTYFQSVFEENYSELQRDNGQKKRPFSRCLSMQSLNDCLPQKKSCKSNYLYFVSEEPVMATDSPLIHNAALEQMVLAHAHMSQNDYAVVDVILKASVLSSLSTAALTSTMWHDATNGNAFVAHHDDGLLHDAFARLAAEIAATFSAEKVNKVVKYYAVAMDLGEVHNGPLSRVEPNQLAVILWLNPFDSTAESSSDGLQIFVQKFNDILNAEGIQVQKDIHPDFLSRSASLEFEQDIKPPFLQQVGRASNRLVLVGPNLPFRLASVSSTKKLGFADSTSIAFVAVLES